MNNYVSTRIKAVPSSKAVQQLLYYARFTIPSYLQSAPSAIIYLFRTGEVWQNIDGHLNDEEHKQQIKKIIMDSVREQQGIYQSKVKKKPQKDSNWIIDGILTFSAEGIDSIKNDDLMQMGIDAVKQIADELHVKPLYILLNLDLTTRQFHYALENINRDTGRSVSRNIKKQTCSRLQDIVGDVFSVIGLQRGKPKTYTNAHYVAVTEGHRIVIGKLEAQIAELESQKAELECEYREALDKFKNIQSDINTLLQEQQALLQKQQTLHTLIQ